MKSYLNVLTFIKRELLELKEAGIYNTPLLSVDRFLNKQLFIIKEPPRGDLHSDIKILPEMLPYPSFIIATIEPRISPNYIFLLVDIVDGNIGVTPMNATWESIMSDGTHQQQGVIAGYELFISKKDETISIMRGIASKYTEKPVHKKEYEVNCYHFYYLAHSIILKLSSKVFYVEKEPFKKNCKKKLKHYLDHPFLVRNICKIKKEYAKQSDSNGSEKDSKNRFHEVRGHFRHVNGKAFTVKPHTRGSLEKGIVTKHYEMSKDVGKEA